MSHLTLVPQSEHLIRDAYEDFLLSRQASLRSPKTIQFYRYTVEEFLGFLVGAGVKEPDAIRGHHVRAFLSKVASRKVKSSTVHAFARGVRAFLRFLYEEEYATRAINVKMPRIEVTQLPVLSATELKDVIFACRTLRDKVLVLVLIDTGLRSAEVLALDWSDVDIASGLVRVRKGKGGKARSVVVGMKTRRALLAYRRTVGHAGDDSVIQTYQDTRLKYAGLRMALKRIGDRAGVKLNAHMLRRTFATMSLRAGINPLHLQALMGHSSLEMTRRYIRLVDEDLVAAHRQHGPVDRFLG